MAYTLRGMIPAALSGLALHGVSLACACLAICKNRHCSHRWRYGSRPVVLAKISSCVECRPNTLSNASVACAGRFIGSTVASFRVHRTTSSAPLCRSSRRGGGTGTTCTFRVGCYSSLPIRPERRTEIAATPCSMYPRLLCPAALVPTCLILSILGLELGSVRLSPLCTNVVVIADLGSNSSIYEILQLS